MILLNHRIDLFDSALCLGHRCLCRLDICLGDFDLLFEGQVIVAGLVVLGPGLGKCCLESARVDLEQQITCLDELIILDRQVDDRPGLTT